LPPEQLDAISASTIATAVKGRVLIITPTEVSANGRCLAGQPKGCALHGI